MGITTCANCGKIIYRRPFEVKRNKSGRFFCSVRCFRKSASLRYGSLDPSWHGGLQRKECLWCRKTFFVYPFRKEKAKFCSHACWHKFRRNKTEERLLKKQESNRRRKLQKKRLCTVGNVCKTCGKTFYTNRSERRVYCSPSCRCKGNSNRIRGSKHHRYSRVEISCDCCGKTIYFPAKRFRNQKHHFCDKDCYYRWHKATKEGKGENHPNWKGGMKFSYTWSYEWREIREMVLARDGYACKECGTNEDLVVHHVIPFKVVNAHHTKNLVTLCRACHSQLHMKENKPHLMK